MSYTVTHIKTNHFHVTDEDAFRRIMDDVCVREFGEIDIYNDDGAFSFTASDDILGYTVGDVNDDTDDPDYSFDAFIHALQTVIPAGEAVIIYTTNYNGDIEAEYDVITCTEWKRGDIETHALETKNSMLSTNISDTGSSTAHAYIIDAGVLVDIDFDNGAYSNVYDKKHGYYDEDRYYISGLKNARETAFEYVRSGVNNSYAIVSESHLKQGDICSDSDDENETPAPDEPCDIKSVIYSVAKIDDKIVEDFIDTTVITDNAQSAAKDIKNIDKIMSEMSEDTFREKVVQYCLDCGTGIEYIAENEDGTHNYTTEKEKTEKPAGTIRYVRPEAIRWFMSPKVRSKTKYVISLRELEGDNHSADTDLINFDEWVALCNIFNCPEMTLHDAIEINGILCKYDITPLDVDTTFNDAEHFNRIEPFVCEQCEKLGINDACDFCNVRRIHEHYHPEKDNT